MEINGDLERFCTLENRPEKFVIEIAALDMTIDERSLEAIIIDRSIQFGGRCIGVCGRKRGNAPKRVGRLRTASAR
jgi:hypothetical protein